MNSAEKSNTRKSPAGSLAKLIQAIEGTSIDKTADVVYEDSNVKLLKIGDKHVTADWKQAVGEHLNDLYEGQDLCDLTLHVGNAKLNIHRVVLSRCSQKYLGIFSSEPEASKRHSDVALVDGVQLESAKQVVQFLYKRKIKLAPDNISDVLAISSQLGITQLVDRCKEFLKTCPADKIANHIILSALHQMDDVKQQLIDLAAKHFAVVSKSEEFVKLSADDLTAVLSSPSSHSDGEAVLFQAILKWLEAVPERSQSAAQLLKTVDLKAVDPRRIALLDDNAEACKIVEVKRILLDAYKHHALSAPHAAASSPLKLSAKPSRPKMEQGVSQRLFKKPFIVGVGGCRMQSDSKANGELVRNFFKYEMSGKTKRWDFLPNMPESCCFHSTVYANGMLYVLGRQFWTVIGGCAVVSLPPDDGSKMPALEPIDTVRCYDPADARWTLMTPMRQKRVFFPAVELAGSIYVLGGIGEDEKALDSVECYSPRANKWKSFTPLPLGCAGSAACAYAGTIFIAGGYLTTFDNVLTMSTVFFFNFEAERWDAKSPMPRKLFFGSAAEAAGALYVLGGAAVDHEGGSELPTSCSVPDVWRCNENATDWTLVGTLKTPRHSAGVVAVGNVIYAIGGLSYGQVDPLSTVEAFNVATRKTTVEPELNLPYRMSGSAFALIPNRT